jgi:hypothetical protein
MLSPVQFSHGRWQLGRVLLVHTTLNDLKPFHTGASPFFLPPASQLKCWNAASASPAFQVMAQICLSSSPESNTRTLHFIQPEWTLYAINSSVTFFNF